MIGSLKNNTRFNFRPILQVGDTGLLDIPHQVQSKIFRDLDADSLSSIRQTCRSLAQVGGQDPRYEASLALAMGRPQDLPNPLLFENLDSRSDYVSRWDLSKVIAAGQVEHSEKVLAYARLGCRYEREFIRSSNLSAEVKVRLFRLYMARYSPSEAMELYPRDKEIVLEVVKRSSLPYRRELLFDPVILADRDVVKEIVSVIPDLYVRLSAELRHDRDVILAAVMADYAVLGKIPKEFRDNEEIIMLAVSGRHPLGTRLASKVVNYIHESMFTRGNFLHRLLRANPFCLLTLPATIKQIPGLVEAYAGKDPYLLMSLVGDGWVPTKATVLEALAIYCVPDIEYGTHPLLERLPGHLLQDREVLELAARYSENTYLYISDDLRDDKEFMIKRVQHRAGDFRYASARLRGDKEIVATAILKNPGMFLNVSDFAREDRDFVDWALLLNPEINDYISPAIMTDHELANYVWRKPFMLSSLSPQVRARLSDVDALERRWFNI